MPTGTELPVKEGSIPESYAHTHSVKSQQVIQGEEKATRPSLIQKKKNEREQVNDATEKAEVSK